MIFAGVTSVDANVETKNVAVTCAASVPDSALLGALQKWATEHGQSAAHA